MADIDRPHKTGHNWLDILIGVAVIFISVASLWVASGESRTQQRLLSASVWPYLQFQSSNATPDGMPRITLTIENAGVGPAKVRWFALYYRDKPYTNVRALLKACCGLHGRTWTLTSSVQSGVLEAHQPLPFITFPAEKNDAKLYKAFDKERQHIDVRACYCSVLDECWLLDTRETEPKPVNDCSKPDPIVFNG
jgi:hypothetical protein